MSVFDRSYRSYDGELKGRWYKIWSIAKSTFRVQFSGKKAILLLIFCNFPVLAFTLMLVFMAMFMPAGMGDMFLGGLFESLDIALYLIIMVSFSAGTIFMPTVFIAALNSGTISNDKKHNALALYMAKPIDRFDYGCGKFISVIMVSSFVTYIPWVIFMLAFTLLGGVTGTEFIQTIWVYFAAFAAAMLVNLFFGSVTLLFSSMTKQSILGGILMILIIFLPTVIINNVNIVLQQDWLNYFSVSSLIASSVYVIFGQPSASSLLGGATDFFGYDINGWISMTILIIISALALLLTIRNLYKEDISG